MAGSGHLGSSTAFKQSEDLTIESRPCARRFPMTDCWTKFPVSVRSKTVGCDERP